MPVDLGEEFRKIIGEPQTVELSEEERQKKWRWFEEFQKKLAELPDDEVLARGEDLIKTFP